MSSEIESMFIHTVTVEAYLGTGAYGDRWADPVTVPCFVDETRRLVRDATGTEVVSEATVYASTGAYELFPPGSRVTVRAASTHVIGRALFDGDALELPSHLAVTLA